MRTRPIATTLRLAFAVAFSVAISVYADSWWLLVAIPVFLAVTIFATVPGRAAGAFTRHPWRASALNAIGCGTFLGSFWLAIGHSRTDSLGYGGTMGVFWFFAYRYSQGPRIVERSERRAAEALTRTHSPDAPRRHALW